MMQISEERRQFLTIFIASLLIFSTIAYISTTPRPREQFFQLYVLGETGKFEEYYPNDSSNIPLNTEVRWYLGVTNSMNTPQLVILKVKLGNSALSPPDDKSATPSNLPVLAEYRRIMLNNETWESSFNWKIIEAKVIGELVYLTLDINGWNVAQIEDVCAVGGRNFRIIVELWTLDKKSGEYIFGWMVNSERKVAWLQIWFNVTLSE